MRAGRPELIVLVHSLAHLTNTTFAVAMAEYAREFLFIERSDLDMPHGLRCAFDAAI